VWRGITKHGNGGETILPDVEIAKIAIIRLAADHRESASSSTHGLLR
jgi:hypothetical protein